VTRRTAALAGAFALALAGVASAAGLSVAPDTMTLVRVPGAVPVKTCTLVAGADAHVDEALPDGTAGSAPALDVTAGASDRRAFVQFDLPACAIPSTAEVRGAALRMTLAVAPAEDRSWKARRVAGAWTEAGITWNTAPPLAASSTDTVPTGTVAGATLTWDVAADVADAVSGAVTDRGWRIADADEAPAAPVTGSLASREDADPADRPSLTVTWFD
jgi:hypothetical protein